jgi:hypothetical protein
MAVLVELRNTGDAGAGAEVQALVEHARGNCRNQAITLVENYWLAFLPAKGGPPRLSRQGGSLEKECFLSRGPCIPATGNRRR